MNRIGKKFIASCLLTSIAMQCLPIDANASSRVRLEENYGSELQEIILSESTNVPTNTPMITEVPTIEPVVTEVPTIVPVVTTAPTSTPTRTPVTGDDRFKPQVVYKTEAPKPNGYVDPDEPKQENYVLERPNVSYYCYYDRMEFEKDNLNVNLVQYDQRCGAVKESTQKIPVKKVRYVRGKTPTLRVKIGECFTISLKGVKNFKRITPYQYKKGQNDLANWNETRSMKTGKECKCILATMPRTEKYGFKVNGKLFTVKVKVVGRLRAKRADSFGSKGYNSKFTYKTVMANVISGGEDIVISKKVENSCSNNSGRTRYCSWDEDNFYVQGYKVPKPPKNIASGYLRTLIGTGTGTDLAIKTYKIPSASKMSREECCKWIRKNGKLLRSIAAVTPSQGTNSSYLAYALYPIFTKAYDYDMDTKFTKNSLVFYHLYEKKTERKRYTWYKYQALPIDLGYYDEDTNTEVSKWGLSTWVGEVYNLLKDYVER